MNIHSVKYVVVFRLEPTCKIFLITFDGSKHPINDLTCPPKTRLYSGGKTRRLLENITTCGERKKGKRAAICGILIAYMN